MSQQLTMLKKETWQREIVIRRNGVLLGESGWEAEFVMFNQDEPDIPIHTSSVANGLIQWLQEGVIRITVNRAKIDNFDFPVAGFYVRVIDSTSLLEDPQGRSWLVCRGTFDIADPFAPVPSSMRNF